MEQPGILNWKLGCENLDAQKCWKCAYLHNYQPTFYYYYIIITTFIMTTFITITYSQTAISLSPLKSTSDHEDSSGQKVLVNTEMARPAPESGWMQFS